MFRIIKRLHKKRIITLAAVSSLAAGCIIILFGMNFYKNRIAQISEADTVNYHKFEYHYAIISEEEDAPFWEDIYQGAFDKGKEKDIFVEKIGSSLSKSYPLSDLMKIAIASKVHGIIIEPDGSEEIVNLINEAEEAGIPVITVLKDAPQSKRKSFVGINSYNQGQTYGNQVLEAIGEGRRKVTVLINSDSKDDSQYTIYSNIFEIAGSEGAQVEAATVNTQSTFSSEEDIRNIIMDTENPPDVLVCLTAIDTLCAYQAVVDYNKVGDIDIIGYYDSELILSAIEKNIIHSTMTIDATKMGAYCVEALMEYRETGQVSDYFSVDISVINHDNIDKYLKENNNDKAEN